MPPALAKRLRLLVVKRLAAILLAACCAGVQAQAQADHPIMAGAAVPPYSAYLGDAGNWSQHVWSQGRTNKGELSLEAVSHQAAEDARQLTWSGDGSNESLFYLRADAPQDFSALGSDAAISVILRVDQKPEGPVKQRVDCGYPCRGQLDMTPVFKAVEPGDWFRLSVPLKCFATAGAKLSQVHAPLVFSTNHPFQLSVSQAAITESPPPASLLKCK